MEDFSKAWNRLAPPACFADIPGLEIWLANLAPLASLHAKFLALLDEAERAEIIRLRQPDDQIRMALRRGLRRLLLARRLSCLPEQLRFGCGSWNKPFIREPAAGAALRFSTSSAADWFLLVMANSTELGCDVESPVRLAWSPRLADSICSVTERTRLAAQPEMERPREFLRLWTAKEAILKLRGSGFREDADIATLLANLQPNECVAELTAVPDVVIHIAAHI